MDATIQKIGLVLAAGSLLIGCAKKPTLADFKVEKVYQISIKPEELAKRANTIVTFNHDGYLGIRFYNVQKQWSDNENSFYGDVVLEKSKDGTEVWAWADQDQYDTNRPELYIHNGKTGIDKQQNNAGLGTKVTKLFKEAQQCAEKERYKR
jgi:hypothetical protein